MAVAVISGVNPVTGPTAGTDVVRITGSGFARGQRPDWSSGCLFGRKRFD